jgi:2-desacetyl-2-hydroxyethyl bacteriochlorophyllide A dehydrogenase
MKAALLVEPGLVEVGNVPDPTPAPDEVLVSPTSVGICGTDKKIFTGGIPVETPRIPAHEIVGRLETAATGSSVGDRVLLDPSIICGRCPRCLEGRSNICERGQLLGRDRDGGLSELIAVPARNVYPLPPSVPDDVAPVIQVLTTCMHAHRAVEIFPGDSVVVVGLGVTGLLHVQLAKMRGASPVVAVTRSQPKLELARALGADVTIRADDEAVPRVVDVTGGGGDVVIECAGTVGTLASAVWMTRPGAQVLAYGTIPAEDGAFPYYELYYRELAIVNARASCPEDFPASIDAVASGAIAVEPLVTHRFPIDEVARAFAADDEGALKAIVEIRGAA